MRHEARSSRGDVARICCLFLAVSAAAGCDDRNQGPPTRYSYFDAVVEFTAEGQRLKAETTVQCMTPGGSPPGHRPLGPTSSHSLVTKRLPSGAGVMFHIPRGCYAAPGRKLPPRDAIPMAYWLDDAAHPTVIERYISMTMIGPGHHIEGIHYAHVTEKYGHGEIPRPYSDPTLEIPWLKGRNQKYWYKKSKVAWIGYLVTYAPEALWSRHRVLTEKLRHQHGIVRLRATEIPETVRRLLDKRTINDGLILPQQNPLNNAPDSPYQLGLRTRAVLLEPKGELTLDSNYHVSLRAGWPTGKVVLRPIPKPINRLARLIVDGTVVKGPFWATYFYDTRSQILFHVSDEGF